MNVDFINPFVESISSILSTMAQLSCERGQPYIKTDQQNLGVVSGLIPMVGDDVHGSLAISFSTATILTISSNMLGETIIELDDSCKDLTGEITNMLSGGARKILWQKGYNFEMSQPQIFTDQPIKHLISVPIIVIPFETEPGKFYIEVALGKRLPKAKLIHHNLG